MGASLAHCRHRIEGGRERSLGSARHFVVQVQSFAGSLLPTERGCAIDAQAFHPDAQSRSNNCEIFPDAALPSPTKANLFGSWEARILVYVGGWPWALGIYGELASPAR